MENVVANCRSSGDTARPCRRGRRARSIAIAGALLAASAPSAVHAQVTTLGKGHTLLVNNGLQMWGLNTDSFQYNFSYNNFANANLNAVMWSFGQSNPGVLSNGQKWGRWIDPAVAPGAVLNAVEMSHISDLVALQVGDEQQVDIENPNGVTKDWFQAAHGGNHFPNQLLYVNSFYINSDADYGNFIAAANPDAISFDGYPFSTPAGTLITPQNWLRLAGQFRRHGLGSAIGATNNAPRPYGMYLQTYHGGDGARDPGDVEMRWQQFVAWTMGYTFTDCFTAGGGNTSLFISGDGFSPHQPTYNQFRESARQSRNLGPALVRLISHGYGPSIVVGKNSAGVTNSIPGSWLPFDRTNAPAGQQHLTSLSATNLGTKNGGQPGDVYVGFFNPLHLSYGDPAGTAYFMVTNGLGGYLDDPTALVSETQQQLTLNFDMGYTTINSLQRLRRSDGQVEIVPLNHLSGSQWRLVFNLEGGTGDLFKYNDGNYFVGAQPVTPTVYWDNDGNAAGNNTSSGAGLGGSGNWDGASSKWYNGSADTPWVAQRNPVFWGGAGVVSVVSPPTVDSLTFKTNGYTLTGSSIVMNRPFISVDTGATATIASALAGNIGIAKSGGGLLRLTGSNTYTGGTTIKGGVVQVSSDAALGTAPSALVTNISLDGGSLQWGANFDLNNNRAIGIGPAGGTIDTQQFMNPSGYNATAGGFRGPGDLTKLGSGTFFAAATTGGLNTTWTGRLIIQEGTWKIVASDGLPFNPPLSAGLQPGQVTLDGGTWQAGANMNITSARRGVTVADGGGAIDTQNFNLTWAGPLAGTSATSTLTKTGSGILRFTGVGVASTYNGNVHIAQGTLRLDRGHTMGDLAAISLADAAGATLSITGDETIGSLSGGGLAGGNVTVAAAATLTTGANNQSTSFAGVISGAGGLTKTGAAALAARSVKLGGPLMVSGGALEISPSGGASGMLESAGLTIVGGALLAMNDNDFIVNYGAGESSPEFMLRDLVKTVAQGGASGISFTPGDNDVTIAVADKTEWGFDAFNGVAIDDTTVIGKYTYYGDANLDGMVTSDDYVSVDVGIGVGDSWVEGDFDMSGDVTSDDYVAVDVNLGKGTSNPLALAELKTEMIALHTAMFGASYVEKLAYAESHGFGATLVPEPSCAAGVIFLSWQIARRRRGSAGATRQHLRSTR